jgi:23S rRNA (cytosine1962-C5)-methyltransferase
LRVTAAAESILRSGHPWLFAESIKEQNREGKTGELAVIYDRRDEFLAVGLFDADSPIRLRILHAGKPQTIDADFWRGRLNAALDRRRGLFDDQATGFRCINGESDGWPGLVLDRYDTTLVLKLYTAAWLPRLSELLGTVLSVRDNKGVGISSLPPHPGPLPIRWGEGRGEGSPSEKNSQRSSVDSAAVQAAAERIVLRLSRNIQDAAKRQFKFTDGQILRGPPLDGPVVFLENGLKFEADVLSGQKTGFFLDQRENRRIVETLAHGRAVLNAFSFSGGFSLYAARGGAKSVTDLDISAHALEASRRNFQLNHSLRAIANCPQKTIQADAFEWLANAPAKQFDLVILDPPSLAKREQERAGAIRAYGRLAEMGIRCLRPKGILLAASCSAHVSADEFFEAVRRTAAKSGQKFAEMQTTRHAADHPASFKEAKYLKAIYLKSG